MIGMLSAIIGSKLIPGSEAIAGGCGLILGTALGGYLHSIKAHCDKEKLILQLGSLPESCAEAVNVAYKSILDNTLEQLNYLDVDCELKLQLGSAIRNEISTFCFLSHHEATNTYHVQKLQDGVKALHAQDSSGIAIERTIDEYFETYLNVNRKDITSENRAIAVATVQIMRNTSIILIQVLKSIASLPGYENEQRLEKCKAIIKDYFSNVLINKSLVSNFNKTFLEYFVSTTTQREILANKIQDHFINLIDQLIKDQREISVQQLSGFSGRKLYELTSLFSDVTARLFDSQAGKEDTEITTYKISHDMLRADTSYATGKLAFNPEGFFKLLKPLSEIAENLNRMAQEDDLLSYVRYQDLFENEQFRTQVAQWKKTNFYNTTTYLSADIQSALTDDILAIYKLLFICQALEKDFLHSAVKYGYVGMVARGEYYTKRMVILFLYEESMKRISALFKNHPYMIEMFGAMNNPVWLESNNIPRMGNAESYLLKTAPIDKKSLIHLERTVTNTVFKQRLNMMDLAKQQMEYVHNTLMNNHYVSEKQDCDDEKVLSNKENRIYLFNVARIFDEFGLNTYLAFNPDSIDESQKSPEKNLFSRLQFTQIQLQKANKMIDALSGKLHIFSSYATKLTGVPVSTYHLKFGEEKIDIDQEMHHFLKSLTLGSYIWEDLPKGLLQVGVDEKQLVFNFNKKGTLLAFFKFHQEIRLLQNHINKRLKTKSNPVLAKFVSELGDLVDYMHAIIEHISLDAERIKKLDANNKRLHAENIRQQQTIAQLSTDISDISLKIEDAKKTMAKLKEKTSEHLEHIAKIEGVNDEIYRLILSEFKENIEDINNLNSTLNGKLDEIQSILSKNSSEEVRRASNELHDLKQDMRSRIDTILKRFNHYEQSFSKANNDIKLAFSNLKQSINQENSLIEELEQQLNKALQQLEEQRQKAAFFETPMGHARIIVYDFKTLFDYLDKSFRPQFNFFSSYRGVKTQNILTFIELLLANQRMLKASMASYHSETDFNNEIATLLDNSNVIHRFHGIINQSTSRAVIEHVIYLFRKGDLINVLKNQGISYHDAQIKLTLDDQLIYKTERMPCPIQPLN